MYPAFSIAAVLLVVAFVFVFFRLASQFDPESVAPEWLDEFSLDQYAPMLRLLDPSDIEFLKRQPGYHPGLAENLLRERRKALAGYLELMLADFNQLVKIGRLMLLNSHVDRSEFARTLLFEQIRFYASVGSIRCRLALTPLGFRVKRLPLLESLANMSKQVRELAEIG
jgi:hypothetical protein